MTRIAFGPRTPAPSWEWVGLGTARALKGYFDITIFDDFERVPAADLVVVVKAAPPPEFVNAAHTKGVQLAYMPIDRYFSAEEVAADAAFFRACDLVLLHSEALAPYFEPFCQRVVFVEHHSRYALDSPATFNPSGYVLWVGACEHLPHVVKWLKTNPLPTDVRLLTNFNNKKARITAHFRAHEIGTRLRFAGDTVNGYRMILWSEQAQESMMRECKAAIDVKGDDFNQSTKPPTKAQQFIASGVPFGCNRDSSVAAYFRRRGFDVADAADADRLLSREYWAETRDFAKTLRDRLSLQAISRSYSDMFEALIDGRLPAEASKPWQDGAVFSA